MQRIFVFLVFCFMLFSGVLLFSDDAQQKDDTESKQKAEEATKKLLSGKNFSFDEIKELLELGADINAKNKAGKSAFLVMIESKNADKNVIKEIAAKNKIDISEAYKGIDSPFHASATKKIDTTKLDFFLDLGISINSRNDKGLTPLHIAATSPNYRAYFDYLLDHNADVNATKDGDDKTPLHLAASSEYETTDIVKKLLNKKADVNKKDKNGQTPLLAVTLDNKNLYQKLNLMKLLIEQGADVNIVDVRSRTPLRALLDSESFGHEHIKCLLEKGTDVNVQHAADGKTALIVFFEIALSGRVAHVPQDSIFVNNVLNDFIKHGANLGIKDKNNITALNLIVRHNCGVGQNILKKLLEDGEGVDWSQDKIAAPVCWALARGAELDVLEYLGRTKADFNQKNHTKRAPLHMLLINSGTNKNNQIEFKKFKFIVDHGADVNEKFHSSDSTPLCVALDRPFVNFEIVKYLVEKGADVRVKDNQQCGVLHSLLHGRMKRFTNVEEEQKICDIVKYLVDNGADINLQDKSNAHRPIHLAALSGSYKIVKYFADQKVELNTKSLHGSTPLHFALLRETNIDLIKFLTQNGCSINDKDSNGKTPFFWATANHKIGLDVLKYLCENENTEINAKDNKGNTPFLLAIKYAINFDAVKYLIEHGVDVKAVNNDGQSALHYLFTRHNRDTLDDVYFPNTPGFSSDQICELISLFVERGVDINSVDKNGMTPIFYSVSSALPPKSNVFSRLIEKGANVNVKNADGQSIIQLLLLNSITIDNNAKKVIEALNINFADQENRTLLHEVILVRNEIDDHHIKVMQSKIQVLLEHGYNINAQDKFGSTALHIAAVRNNSNLALVLIKNGADVNAKDNNGATPLHDALEHNNFKESVLKVLIEAGADLNAKDIFGMTPQDVISPPNKESKETFLREIIKQKEKEKK